MVRNSKWVRYRIHSVFIRDAKILENVTLILILEFREFSRITLKIFSVIYCPHSHSQTSRIFEDSQKFSKLTFLRVVGIRRVGPLSKTLPISFLRGVKKGGHLSKPPSLLVLAY